MTDGIVTLLFTDLVGSTALLDELGDDEFDRLRRVHFKMLREQVTAAGGNEVKSLGDGLMVVVPGAVDAVRCAVEMQRAVAGAPGAGVEVRVGLHVGDPIRDEDDYFGLPVVVARRLCDLAQGGQILASSLVRDLVGTRGGFEFRPLGEVELRGLSAPVAAFEVGWDRAAAATPLPPALARVAAEPFVGRDNAVATLQAGWDVARAGGCRVVLVAGEPGIGKTRVAAEVSAAAHGDGATVLYGRCDEDTLVPHQPFVEALTQLLAGVGSERLAALLGDTAPDLARLLPDLPRRLELDAAPAGDAEMSRYLMFEAVSGLLRETTLRAPAMIVLDDLHWADAPTLRLLRHLVTQAQPERLLVVGTYRDTDLDRTHPLAAVLADLRKETTVDRVLLGGLSEPEIASLLEKVSDQSADEQSKALAAALHQETEGNPFFVREVLRHLVETGALYQRDGRWTSDVPATTVGIPEGVRDVIGRRLSRLDDQTNEALAAAAVLGRDFALDDLVAVTGVAPDALVAMLDGAVAAAVVTEVAGAVDRWAFTHALVRQTLTEELTTSRRVRLHRDIARAIAARPDAADRVSELALHYGEAAAAGCLQEAVDYALLAGEQAFERLAFEQAAAHFRTGLDLVDLDPDPDEGDRAHLLLYLGRALHHCGEPQVAAVRLRDATIAARKAGDAQTFARAAIERTTWGAALGAEWTEDDDLLDEAAGLVSDDPALRARVLAEHVRWRSLWPTETLRAMSEEAVTLARASRDPAALALALAGAVWLTSDATGAEAVLDEVRSSQDRDNRDWQDELIFLQLGTIAALARAMSGVPGSTPPATKTSSLGYRRLGPVTAAHCWRRCGQPSKGHPSAPRSWRSKPWSSATASIPTSGSASPSMRHSCSWSATCRVESASWSNRLSDSSRSSTLQFPRGGLPSRLHGQGTATWAVQGNALPPCSRKAWTSCRDAPTGDRSSFTWAKCAQRSATQRRRPSSTNVRCSGPGPCAPSAATCSSARTTTTLAAWPPPLVSSTPHGVTSPPRSSSTSGSAPCPGRRAPAPRSTRSADTAQLL